MERASEVQLAVDAEMRVGFLGTYPPRRCGIATFTRDLATGMQSADARVRALAVAITEPGGRHEYPEAVEYEIQQGTKGDYARAAELVNYKDVRWVSVQHEYGIFGGDDGAYVLDFLDALRVPAVVTLHTVLQHPSPSQRAIVQKMAASGTRLVVMSGVAADLLAQRYELRGAPVQIIPHGIPDMAPRSQNKLKAKFGVAGHRMMLTFGLLGPNKGIETVLRALPAAIAAFPDLVYFVVGATHPAIVKQHGEAYRTTLEREAEALGVRDHVVFRDQYVTTDELCSYLQAADLFVSPYLNEAQVTSGALSYAMGAGAAVLSTPYWHAKELLAEGRGRLFPFGDSAALAREITALFGAPDELARIRAGGYEYTRAFTWPRVGARYLELGATVMSSGRRPSRQAAPRASGLPELRLDHLLRMTDDTGIIQHATFTVPARTSGYCVDDNARALIVALHADRLLSSAETNRLVSTYLAFLLSAQTEDGRFLNFMTYDRKFVEESAGVASDDCTGRALWALGIAAQAARDEGHQLLARQMFERGLSAATELGPRGTALTMLGLASFVTAHGEVAPAVDLLRKLARRLCDRYRDHATPAWRWFEPTLTYDNALLPLALFRAHALSPDAESLRIATESLGFLEETCFLGDRLRLVGNAGWHHREGARPDADEQPTDAAAFVLAFRSAYRVTGDHRHLRRMREAFAWFLGANRLGVPVYDSATAGCRDGLGVEAPNQNEGAESTIAFLLSLMAMLELAGEGLDSNTPPAASPPTAERVRHEMLTRTLHRLLHDPRRVIAKPYLPGEEIAPGGPPRAALLMQRVLAIPEGEVTRMLARVLREFRERHRDFEQILERHFALVAHHVADITLSRERRLLIGAYFTNEYSVEGAALFNPSIVPAPDQAGRPAGERGFVMSLRAVGEGHISSIEFRTGTLDAASTVRFDQLGTTLVTGDRTPPASYDKQQFRAKLIELGAANDLAWAVLDRLPDPFTAAALEQSLIGLERDGPPHAISFETAKIMRVLAASSYVTTFPDDSALSERVIFPAGPHETRGMEDARFVRFTDDDGRATYYATYTAFDGYEIVPQLIQTDDFRCFRIATLHGPAAQNKGMALFPRRVGGRYVMLSRRDRENLHLATSNDVEHWSEVSELHRPSRPWELAQIGNCGSPIETAAGWLVITHGVGPMRRYVLGALLLDLEDPRRVIGQLREPLLEPDADERDGYVPNVVYSCGGMANGDDLVLPYGLSDGAVGIAVISIPALLVALAG